MTVPDPANQQRAAECPTCPHSKSEHWRGDHSCQHRDENAYPDRLSWMRDRWCPCPGTAPIPEEPR